MASAPERKSQPLSISTGNILVSGSASSGNGLHSGSVGGDIANNGEIDAVHNDSLTTSINSNLMSTSQISTVSFGGVSLLIILIDVKKELSFQFFRDSWLISFLHTNLGRNSGPFPKT